MPVITVFGSGKVESHTEEYKNAEIAGRLLAKSGFDIATGAYGGVMEAVLKGAAPFDVERFGYTFSNDLGLYKNRFVNVEYVSITYYERLTDLIDIGDAFLVLPGGPGTLLELSAAWNAVKKGLMRVKPIVCLGEQWSEMVQVLSFYSEEISDSAPYLRFAKSPEEAVDILVKSFKY